MSVQEYLEKHRLSRKIEDAVNAAVRAKTPDPILYISNHMKKAVPAVITKIVARQILDSRGNPTVEVDLHTNKGLFRAAVPSGDSSGLYEALELRDDDKSKYLGKGVSKALKNVNEIISGALIGMDPTLQSEIDHRMIELDKTENKARIKRVQTSFAGFNISSASVRRDDMFICVQYACGELGANAILAVSLAACRAGAAEKEVPLYKYIADLAGVTKLVLPVPAFTVISGGTHASNTLAAQEIMILPVGASSFEEAMQMGAETYHHLKAVISEKIGLTGCNVGDGGGFTPNISRQVFVFVDGFLLSCDACSFFRTLQKTKLALTCFREALDLVKEAIDRAGYSDRVKMAIDVAATNFCIGKKYDLDFKVPNKSGENFKTGEEMIELYTQFCSEYPIFSITDPFDKDDWENTKLFSATGACQIVGGDLLMSNASRMEKARQDSVCNSLLLKVNQVGTITEAIEVVKMAKDSAWGVVVSDRGGDTEDSFIADLAVGLAAGQIKAGAPCRSERLAKYNQWRNLIIQNLYSCYELKKSLETTKAMQVRIGDHHDKQKVVPAPEKSPKHLMD
ncbi:Cytosolic enolase 3 [Nymphaea thermarum]|nr:Cytosolic enolase 3 [Nymphaea thermarum]